jgi:predicted esterase
VTHRRRRSLLLVTALLSSFGCAATAAFATQPPPPNAMCAALAHSAAATASPTECSSSSSDSQEKKKKSDGGSLLKTAAVIPVKHGKAHKKTIIWMHGLGDSSDGFKDVFEQFGPEYTRVVLPNAKERPVTINGGMRMQAWYDILSMDRKGGKFPATEDDAGINESRDEIHKLLDYEAELVGGAEHVLLGGFSQGAAMTVYAGLSYPQRLAGLIATSGYLLLHQQYAKDAKHIAEAQKSTPLLAYHGARDAMVPVSFCKLGYELLKSRGCDVEYHEEAALEHSLSHDEIKVLKAFWTKQLKL